MLSPRYADREAAGAADPLARIVQRSVPLHERIARGREPGAERGVADPADGVAAEWCRTVAAGDPATFEKRLAWDGLRPEHLTRVLGCGRADGEPLPEWAAVLREAYAAPALPRADRALDPARPIPFEEFLLPLVQAARGRLRERAGRACSLLAEEPQRTLERCLLQQLARIAGRALLAEFSVFRAIRQQSGGLNALIFASLAPGSRMLYDGFLGSLEAGGFHSFWERYSVAARLCAQAADTWSAACARFLLDLRSDLPELQTALGGDQPLGSVSEVTTGLSDPHEGGRSVIVCRFQSGTRIVYKPRPLGLEEAFSGLAHWLDGQGCSLSLRTLRLVSRPTHGWIEFAEGEPCGEPEQVERFYRRGGMLLALVYGVNGTDFHRENLLACGEHPVLIDMEALVTPAFELDANRPGGRRVSTLARERLDGSVVRTGLLPTLHIGDEGEVSELGALACGRVAAEPVLGPKWTGVNTDAMKLGQARMTDPAARRNLPEIGEERVDASAHVEQVAEGFREVYGLLLAGRDDLLAPGGPLDGLRGQRVRFLFRNTSLYAAAIERALHPRYLRDGAEHGVQLEALAQPLLTPEERPGIWPILRAEHAALERMDIPLFAALSDSTSLVLPDGAEIRDCFPTSALDAALERIRKLSAEDLDFQLGVIRGSFAAAARRGLRSASAPGLSRPARSMEPDALRQRSIRYALRVAELLSERAIRSPEGETTWLVSAYQPAGRRFALAPGGSGTLDGFTGTALFLGALERVTGGCGFRDLALAAVRPLCRPPEEMDPFLRFRRHLDLGAGTGIGGAVYALTRLAEWLSEPALLRSARDLAGLFTPERIAADRSLDVVAGGAGAILGLLALYGATRDPAVLAAAGRCGAHLLERRERDEATGLGGWRGRRGRAEHGFAHGQAGIACALLRLFRARGGPEVVGAAREALALDRALAHGAAEAVAGDRCAAWSHGSVGLGHAWLEALDVLGPAEAEPGIADALGRSRAALAEGPTSLGCGRAGHLDLLLSAGVRRNDANLREAASEARIRLLLDAEEELRRGDGGFDLPSLFGGPPGVAYALLRACEPERLPSVLSWS